MTNTVPWDEMTGRSRIKGRFIKQSQGVIDAGLARSDGLSDAVDEIESQRDERRRNRALAITNFPMCHRHSSREIPPHIRGAAIRDFEEVSQAADFPIATPAARIRSRPKCKSPPVLADRDQQKS
jgi:hypothetical protein